MRQVKATSAVTSFDDTSELRVSDRVSAADRESLGLIGCTGLRWVAPEHLPFLGYHRKRMVEGVSAANAPPA
jgi:hypothetical protein